MKDFMNFIKRVVVLSLMLSSSITIPFGPYSEPDIVRYCKEYNVSVENEDTVVWTFESSYHDFLNILACGKVYVSRATYNTGSGDVELSGFFRYYPHLIEPHLHLMHNFLVARGNRVQPPMKPRFSGGRDLFAEVVILGMNCWKSCCGHDDKQD